jgi:hypothetical protein
MRWGILLVAAVSLCLVGAAAFAQGPILALISTEVDDGLDGAGTFMDREVLSLYPPNFPWSYNTSDVFFDPGDVLGIETGLDAFDLRALDGGQPVYFFSTEVDFEFEGVAYTDQDLLVYDPVLDIVSRAWDSTIPFGGADLGLDAACWFFDDHDSKWLLTFSTEVGGTALIDGNPTAFTGGDILVTDGTELVGWLDMTSVFGREVGLDALHIWMQGDSPDNTSLGVLFSTEVDGVVRAVDGDLQGDLDPLIEFRDQDLLSFSFAMGPDGPGSLIHTELAWQGIEDGFGRDVGLDAVYIEFEPIPEPATMLLVGLGLAGLGLRLRKRG